MNDACGTEIGQQGEHQIGNLTNVDREAQSVVGGVVDNECGGSDSDSRQNRNCR